MANWIKKNITHHTKIDFGSIKKVKNKAKSYKNRKFSEKENLSSQHFPNIYAIN